MKKKRLENYAIASHIGLGSTCTNTMLGGESEQLICTYCGINPIKEKCPHPKKCSDKKKVKAN